MNRKLDIGTVLERVFETYRDQFGLLIPAAIAVFVPVAVLNGLILSGGGVFAALIAGAIALVATYFFQGMVVEAAQDILDGRRDHTVGSLFSSVVPVLGPLVLAGLLAGIATAVGFVLLIVPGLFLLTIWAVIAPVIVLERTGAIQAFSRSYELVRGHGWQVFGVIAIIFLLRVVLGGIVRAIFVGVSDTIIGYSLADLLVQVFVGPLAALAAAILYFELKRLHAEEAPATGAVAPEPSRPVPGGPPPEGQPPSGPAAGPGG